MTVPVNALITVYSFSPDLWMGQCRPRLGGGMSRKRAKNPSTRNEHKRNAKSRKGQKGGRVRSRFSLAHGILIRSGNGSMTCLRGVYTFKMGLCLVK